MSWDPGRLGRRGKPYAILKLLRIEHTVFSLPFAYAGAVLAEPRALDALTALLIALAVFGLRTAGMAFNNIADYDVDAANPRTRKRPLVAGVVGFREAWICVATGLMLYLVAAYTLNIYAAILSPLPLVAALSYPYAKRLHWLPHIHLGAVLGMVVFGGAVAAAGRLYSSLYDVLVHVPWLYMVYVMLWVAGFDTYYSLLDEDFDRRMGLGSLAAKLGKKWALAVSTVLHVAAAVALYTSLQSYGILSLLGFTATSILLGIQHMLLWRHGVKAVAKAFNMNLLTAFTATIPVIVEGLTRVSLA